MPRYLAPCLFSATLLVSAGLLFLVEPMIAKMILPKFGGTPAVWNTSVMFFQAALLGGYLYAHFSVRLFGVRRQTLGHLALMLLPVLVFLPIGIPEHWAPPADSQPIWPLLALLLGTIGLPFFVLAASAPLLQDWFARSGHATAEDPYFLYAASNAGSMLALCCYPTFIEPGWTLKQQSAMWGVGYSLLIALFAVCGWMTWRGPGTVAQQDANLADESPARLSTRVRLHWILLAFVPSSMMLGVTTYLTTDISPVPMLWTIPLALYLLSFIFAFAKLPRGVHRLMAVLLPVGLIYVAANVYSVDVDLRTAGVTHLAAFFVVAMVCHHRLAELRPHRRYLTEYFVWMSFGGLLGGIFNGLIAPCFFPAVWEYPLILVVAATQLPPLFPQAFGAHLRLNKLAPVLLTCAVAGLLWNGARRSDLAGQVVLQVRSFYGALRLVAGTKGKTYSLAHGNICHGTQLRSSDPRQRRLPMTYYFPTGPIGQLFQAFRGANAKSRVGIVGLGIGSLASYGEPGQQFTFFELDPTIERLARDKQFFTFLADAADRGVDVSVVLGDARLTLAECPDNAFDLLIVDAFSGDAIPMHLLTREALDLYLHKLSATGVIAFHITNGYLDLTPVLTSLASDATLVGMVQDETELSPADRQRGKSASTWLVVARAISDFGPLAASPRWTPLPTNPATPVWTDDYSNLFGALRK